MAISRTAVFTTAILCIFSVRYASAYDTTTCCSMAKNDSAFIDPIPPLEDQICGQQYSTTLMPAQPLYISYSYCSTKCAGVGISRPDQPRQWAAPIVQFILPSVIFSLSIPRRKKIAYEYLFDWPVKVTSKPGLKWVNNTLQLLRSLTLFTVILLPVVIDTLIWIFVIIICAAHMLVGALYEAHLDYRILKYVESMAEDEDPSEEDLAIMRDLLVTVASGNLVLDKGAPHTAIPESLTVTADANVATGHEKSRSRLLNLVGAQYSFGSAVGSPVIFYLGAFVYTILDLKSDPSDEDSALSLSFGMEWMIIVHVAIVSGCLLASNNPSTSSGIVGGGHEALHQPAPRPRRTNTFEATARIPGHTPPRDWSWYLHTILGWTDAYETEFQPVSLWSRGMNKMNWIRESTAWGREDLREAMRISAIGWTWKVFVPTVLLITVPPVAGAVVAYITPPRGIACRSLSFILYAVCQFALSIIAILQNALDNGRKPSWTWTTSITTLWSDIKGNLQWLCSGKGIWAMSGVWWFGSLMAAIGGTTMQITGVYRNCACYAGAESWWRISEKNPSIQIATDTEDKRNSSNYWLWVGSTAMIFMVLNCYIGWWYQKLIRRRFTNVVKALARPHPEAEAHPTHPPRMPQSPPVFDVDLSDDRARLLGGEGDYADSESFRRASRSSLYAAQSSIDARRLSPTRFSFGQEISPPSTGNSTVDIAMNNLMSPSMIRGRPVPRGTEED